MNLAVVRHIKIRRDGARKERIEIQPQLSCDVWQRANITNPWHQTIDSDLSDSFLALEAYGCGEKGMLSTSKAHSRKDSSVDGLTRPWSYALEAAATAWDPDAMHVIQGSISGLLEVFPQKHQDDRGYFSETFKLDWFRENVSDLTFVQENESLSRKAGTVRGLHFQSEPYAQGKLVRCLAGRIFDVAVDIRHGSPTFGQWASVELSAELGNQFWVPAGFAHGFCTLTPDCVLSYKVTSAYSPVNDLGVSWDDPSIGILWPQIANPDTLSDKDRQQPMLSQLSEYFYL